jgi:hypothetical protein
MVPHSWFEWPGDDIFGEISHSFFCPLHDDSGPSLMLMGEECIRVLRLYDDVIAPTALVRTPSVSRNQIITLWVDLSQIVHQHCILGCGCLKPAAKSRAVIVPSPIHGIRMARVVESSRVNWRAFILAQWGESNDLLDTLYLNVNSCSISLYIPWDFVNSFYCNLVQTVDGRQLGCGLIKEGNWYLPLPENTVEQTAKPGCGIDVITWLELQVRRWENQGMKSKHRIELARNSTVQLNGK